MGRKKPARRRRATGGSRSTRQGSAKGRKAKKTRKATTSRKPAKRSRPRARRVGPDLLGPPPAEALLMRGDREREEEARLRAHTETSPELTGGDVDADWERAAAVGEEAVGGTVVTPDQNVVDELGKALGVPQAPDEPFRSSEEILEARDARRARQEG
jgi:hypothetical protein